MHNAERADENAEPEAMAHAEERSHRAEIEQNLGRQQNDVLRHNALHPIPRARS